MSSIKYDREHARNLTIKFYDTKDADLLAWLEQQPTKGGYIKQLIRDDMERKNAPKQAE